MAVIFSFSIILSLIFLLSWNGLVCDSSDIQINLTRWKRVGLPSFLYFRNMVHTVYGVQSHPVGTLVGWVGAVCHFIPSDSSNYIVFLGSTSSNLGLFALTPVVFTSIAIFGCNTCGLGSGERGSSVLVTKPPPDTSASSAETQEICGLLVNQTFLFPPVSYFRTYWDLNIHRSEKWRLQLNIYNCFVSCSVANGKVSCREFRVI